MPAESMAADALRASQIEQFVTDGLVRLDAAFDHLVGAGRWRPCQAMGTFPVRFPHEEDASDTGWHIDASFGGDSPDFWSGAPTSPRAAAAS